MADCSKSAFRIHVRLTWVHECYLPRTLAQTSPKFKTCVEDDGATRRMGYRYALFTQHLIPKPLAMLTPPSALAHCGYPPHFPFRNPPTYKGSPIAICATEVGEAERYKDCGFAIWFSTRPALFKLPFATTHAAPLFAQQHG